MEKLTAESRFDIEASQARVWDLLGRVVFDSLHGIKKVEILDENNFRAELKTKAFGISLRMYLRGEMTDILPPEAISVRLAARSKWNLIRLVQRVTFTLNSAEEGKTAVVCKAMAEDLNPIFRWALLGQVKRVVTEGYDRARQILEDNSDTLIRVAEALLEREVLDSVQIAALVEGEELPVKSPTEEGGDLPLAAAENADEPADKAKEAGERPGVLPAPGNQPA